MCIRDSNNNEAKAKTGQPNSNNRKDVEKVCQQAGKQLDTGHNMQLTREQLKQLGMPDNNEHAKKHLVTIDNAS